MHIKYFLIVLFSLLSPKNANKYAEHFDDQNVWKYLYKEDFKVTISNAQGKRSYDPQQLETKILERSYDEIFSFISTLESPGNCFPAFQSIINEKGKTHVDEDFYMIGEGGSGSVFYFQGNAVKIVKEDKIGLTKQITRFAHKEKNLKYFIRELNTGNIILNSYLKPDNILTNLNMIFDSCVEKSVTQKKRSEHEVEYRIFMRQPFFPLSLRDVLDNSNPLFEQDSYFLKWKLEVLDGIILGVYWIHLNGYAHRDLKPTNILLSDKAVPMISDFGFAKEFSETTSSVVGSPRYMAPEIRVEQPVYTHKVDVYSLGVIMFEVLNMYARVNTQSMSRQDILDYCQSVDFPMMSVERNIKEIYCAYYHSLITQMLQVEPQNRPEMIDVVRAWIQFRMQAESKDETYEQALYQIVSAMDSAGQQSNFLIQQQPEPMEIEELDQTPNSSEKNMDIEMYEQPIGNDSHSPRTEITLLTITTDDPSFSTKCFHLFDILKSRFEQAGQMTTNQGLF